MIGDIIGEIFGSCCCQATGVIAGQICAQALVEAGFEACGFGLGSAAMKEREEPSAYRKMGAEPHHRMEMEPLRTKSFEDVLA
mmetsp:Transcript_37334/g.116739  ORF Transcript_37334/g.116739 Transcript_37334/m.116739 type:complete len:83 (-) Transcript_37334:797-1045(-)